MLDCSSCLVFMHTTSVASKCVPLLEHKEFVSILGYEVPRSSDRVRFSGHGLTTFDRGLP